MENKTTIWVIRDRECGNGINEYLSFAEAELALARFEQEDKDDGVYVEDFYEVIEVEKN